MGNKVVICGIDTSVLPSLNHSRSVELLNEIKNGNEESRNYFINCNLRLVLSIVNRYSSRTKELDDIFQMGCVGLIKSIDNFNVEVGVRFSTYAVPMIEGEIRRYLRESNSLRISRGVRDVAYEAITTRERLESERSEEVGIDDVAKEMNLPVCKVLYCLDAISDPVSLFDPVYSDEEDDVEVQEYIADAKSGEVKWVDHIALSSAIDNLCEKEREVLHKRYFEDKTQNEISDEIGLSQAQVSRIEKNAVEHLRAGMC